MNKRKNHFKYSQVLEIEKIETEDDLNKRAKEFENQVQALSGVQKFFLKLKLNESVKKEGSDSQKKRLVDNSNETAIRDLFNQQHHRAVQEILFGPTFYCQIDSEAIQHHYQTLFGKSIKCNISNSVPYIWEKESPSDKANWNLCKKFTTIEVRTKLASKAHHKFYNSRSTGPDHIKYIHLLMSDKSSSMVTAFFNACLRLNTVPKIWTDTYSVLIKKQEGDDNDIKKWYLVTMFRTISILFQSLIATRLMIWAKATHRLSPTQKGFHFNNAVCESSFILQECRSYAQNCHKDLCITWLDFKDASDVIPHSAILEILLEHSVTDPIRNLIENLLKNLETKIRVSDVNGFTNPIKILNGLPRGSPLNPVLMNLVIEPILRSLLANNNKFEIFNQKLNHFVIPNELTLIAESPIALQNLLNLVEKIAKAIGLHFNIDKCKSYHYNGVDNIVKETKFTFFEQTLQVIPEKAINDYFGVKQGFSIGQNGIPTIDEMMNSMDKIDKSLLDGFQKTTSILAYIIPRVENYLRGLPSHDTSSLTKADTELKKKVKTWLGLLPEATAESIVYHVSKFKHGYDLNYLPFLDLFYIMKIVHGIKILTSEDDLVRNIAFDSLTTEVTNLIPEKSKIKSFISNVHLAKYLAGDLHIKNVQTNTIWQLIRTATLKLNLKIYVSWKYSNGMKLVLLENKKKKRYLTGNYPCNPEEQLKNSLVDFYVDQIEKYSSGTCTDNIIKKGKAVPEK